MKIKYGEGIDNIKLGILEEDLKNILGEPDKVNRNGIELEKTTVLYYNSMKTKFKFDQEEDDMLFIIETFNPDAELFGKNIIGMSKDQIKSLLKQNNISITDENDFVTIEALHSEQISITFMFEFNCLTSVEIFPLFLDEYNIKWPL